MAVRLQRLYNPAGVHHPLPWQAASQSAQPCRSADSRWGCPTWTIPCPDPEGTHTIHLQNRPGPELPTNSQWTPGSISWVPLCYLLPSQSNEQVLAQTWASVFVVGQNCNLDFFDDGKNAKP